MNRPKINHRASSKGNARHRTLRRASILLVAGGISFIPIYPANAALTLGSGVELHKNNPQGGLPGNGTALQRGTREACAPYTQTRVVAEFPIVNAGDFRAASGGIPIVVDVTVDTVTNVRYEGPGGTYNSSGVVVGGAGSGCTVGATATVNADSGAGKSPVSVRQGTTELCQSGVATSIRRTASYILSTGATNNNVRVIGFSCPTTPATSHTLTATYEVDNTGLDAACVLPIAPNECQLTSVSIN